MNLNYKKLAALIIIILTVFMLFREFNPQKSVVSMIYSDFLGMVESGSVIQVIIQGDKISGLSTQGPFNTFAPKDPELIKLLRYNGVKISIKLQRGSSWISVLLLGPDASADRGVDILHAPESAQRRAGPFLWKKPGETHVGFPEKNHIRRCSRD